MEHVKCNLCGGDDTYLLYEKDGYNIVKCNSCGLLYVNPRDSIDKLIRIYGRPYFELEKSKRKDGIGYRNYIKDKEIHKIYFRKKIKQIKKIKPEGRLLDIGCATGFFLEEAQKEGFDVWGVDVSPYAVKIAKEVINNDKIFLGTIKEVPLKRESLDVITCFQTLEHSPDPLGELLQMHRLLKIGGVIILTLPDQGSFYEKIMRRGWFAYKPKEHLYYFNSKTIKRMIQKAGFKRISVRWDDARLYPLGYILERVGYLYHKLNTLTLKGRRLLNRFKFLNLKVPVFLGDLQVVAFK